MIQTQKNKVYSNRKHPVNISLDREISIEQIQGVHQTNSVDAFTFANIWNKTMKICNYFDQ